MPGGFWNEDKDTTAARVGKHSGAWTPEEDDYLLRERSAGRTFRNIAEVLGRTVSSTSGRHDNLVMREIYSGFDHERPVHNYDPLYDPKRDGCLPYADLTAELLGDPPIGRREIMERLAHG